MLGFQLNGNIFAFHGIYKIAHCKVHTRLQACTAKRNTAVDCYKRAIKGLQKKQFRAYVRLEMAMSIDQYNKIKSYWRNDMFVEQKDFKNTVSRTRFQQICGCLSTYHPKKEYRQKKISKDPLWHSRSLIRTLPEKMHGYCCSFG